jgi:hypothetical protein
MATVYRVRRRGIQKIFDDFVNVYAVDDSRARLALQATMVKALCMTDAPLSLQTVPLREKLFKAWSTTLFYWRKIDFAVEPVYPSSLAVCWSPAVVLATLALQDVPGSEGCIAVTPHQRREVAKGDVLLVDHATSVRQYVADLQEILEKISDSRRLDWRQLAAWRQLFGSQYTNVRWALCQYARQTAALYQSIWQPHFQRNVLT